MRRAICPRLHSFLKEPGGAKALPFGPRSVVPDLETGANEAA
jgi:hypothetical protein